MFEEYSHKLALCLVDAFHGDQSRGRTTRLLFVRDDCLIGIELLIDRQPEEVEFISTSAKCGNGAKSLSERKHNSSSISQIRKRVVRCPVSFRCLLRFLRSPSSD